MKVVYSPKHIPDKQRKDEEEDGEEGEMYEVDYIMQHRENNGKYEYLIKWKGFDKGEATWEPEEHINDPQCVERYFKLLLAKKQVKKVTVRSLLVGNSTDAANVVIRLRERSRRQ